MSIYKPCDIRGKVDGELNADLYRSWGRTLGRRAPDGPFIVGGDVRRSTPPFLEALAEGLCDAGRRVIHVGQCPTPMIYFAKRHHQAAACAIVTASHNPAPINGLKWMLGDQPPTPEDLAALEKEVEMPADAGGAGQGTVDRVDVGPDYLAWLAESWRHGAADVALDVVIDPLLGCWAGRAGECLRKVFPQSTFHSLADAPDPDFGGISPDCSRRERLQALGEQVQSRGADVGLAFDGDGDRVAAVDATGTPLGPEAATWVLLQSFGPELAGERFVVDLKFSQAVARTAAELGAEPVAERSGHAFIRAKMLAVDARFGAEVSGHYFFRELDGGDDGLFAACRLLAYLGRAARPLDALRRESPPVYMTPDLRLAVDPADREPLIRAVQAAWPDRPQSTIDGVRIDFSDGWALMRPSVTEPAITFRFEAGSWEELDALVARFCERLPKLGPELAEEYQLRRRPKTPPRSPGR